MPNGETVVLAYGQEIDDYEFLKYLEEKPRSAGRVSGGGIGRSIKKTKEELEFLSQRKERMDARSSSIYCYM